MYYNKYNILGYTAKFKYVLRINLAMEMYRNSRKITTTADLKDLSFIKDRKIKVSHVLRGAIRDLRDKEAGVLPDYERLAKQREAILKLLARARDFIEKKGLINEYLESEQHFEALERANLAKEKI